MKKEKVSSELIEILDKLVESEDTHDIEGREIALMGWRVNADEILFSTIIVSTNAESTYGVLIANIHKFISSLSTNTTPIAENRKPSYLVVADSIKSESMNPLKSIILENIQGLRNKTLDINTAKEISSQVETLINIGRTELEFMRELNRMKQ